MSGEYRVGCTDDVSVRFVDSEDGALSVLEIENPRDHQVFGEVRSTLRAAGVEVVSFEVRVERDTLCGRLRLVDSGGALLDQQRHLEIQDRVLDVALARTKPVGGVPPAEAAG